MTINSNWENVFTANPDDDWQHNGFLTEPAMHLYFNHMNLYHISHACTGGTDFNYVRKKGSPTHFDIRS